MKFKLRIPKRGWTLIHLALLLWAAWIAAGIVDGIISGATTTAAPRRPAAPERSVAKVSFEPAPDYSYILKRNIFNSSQSPGESGSLEAQGASPDALDDGLSPESAPKTPLGLKLIGTVTDLLDELRFAVIEITKTGEQRLLRKNGEILGARIIRIERNRVFLERQGTVEALGVDFAGEDKRHGQKMASLTPAAGLGGPGVRKISEGEFMISKRFLESKLKNMNRLLTKARAIPNINKDGVTDGFKVFSIKKGSIFDKIGLKNHDVIKRINGVELDSAEKGLELFQALRNETNFEVDLVRNAKKTSMRFTIQ
ncbi:MAG: type II secretion system protein GspC [Candidatus Nitrospinota bacterium M3_3B_026]